MKWIYVCCVMSFLLIALPWNLEAIATGRTIRVGQIRLDQIEEVSEVHQYALQVYELPSKVTISLYGHQFQEYEPIPPHLTNPSLTLLQRRTGGQEWTEIDRAQAEISGVEIVRLQNVQLDGGFEYRIGVGTEANQGGRYALVVDIVHEEFEIEELNLGISELGEPYRIAASYAVPDVSAHSGKKIYVGTERGYVLVSEDDAKSWRKIYPPPGGWRLWGSVYGLFVDSQGIIYVSPWTSGPQVENSGYHGVLLESRDGGLTWNEAIHFECPTGCMWRMAEDRQGNIFAGEYTATITWPNPDAYTGNIWRRKNFGGNGESFEVVYRNPPVAGYPNNHVHYVACDPYTGDIYATIGDDGPGRFIRSKRNGDPDSWEILEIGVDSQYTALTFTQDSLYLGQDTNQAYKKIVCWPKTKSHVTGSETFWTTTSIDNYPKPPVPWADTGNWYWGESLRNGEVLLFGFLPYGVSSWDDSLMQPPRLYAGLHNGSWWRALTFPPLPKRSPVRPAYDGVKLASNVDPDGWIYAMRGAYSSAIQRGFRIRLKPDTTSSIKESPVYP